MIPSANFIALYEFTQFVFLLWILNVISWRLGLNYTPPDLVFDTFCFYYKKPDVFNIFIIYFLHIRDLHFLYKIWEQSSCYDPVMLLTVTKESPCVVDPHMYTLLSCSPLVNLYYLESVDLSNLPTLTQADKNKKDAGFIHSHSFVQSTGNIGSFHNWLFYETRLEDINLDKNRMQKIFHWWRLRHKTTAIIVIRDIRPWGKR